MAVNHFRLVAELRWNLFRNSVRVPRGRVEFLSTLLIALIASVIVLGIGLVAGASAYALVLKTRALGLPVVLWPIFIFWQLGPLFMEMAGPQIDLRQLARFPVPFHVHALLHAAFRLLDPVGLISAFWLLCVWVGVTLARPAWLLPAGMLLAVFAALNLLFAGVLIAFADSLMRTRRGREAFTGALIGAGVLFQIAVYAVAPRLSPAGIRLFLKMLNQVSPPGLAAAVLGESIPRALLSAVGLALYGAAAAFAAHRQLRGLYAGEVISDSRPGRRGRALPGWRFPGLSPSLSAALEKEVRYSLGDLRTLMSMLAGPLGALIFVLGAQIVHSAALHYSLPVIYAGLLAFAALALGETAYNSFCYDGAGLYRWLLAPVPLRAAFAAKNMVVSFLMAASFALTTLFLSRAAGFSWKYVPAAGLAMAFVCLGVLGCGNLFSAWFPTRVEYGSFNARNPSGATALLGLLTKAAILGCCGLLGYAWRRWHDIWIPAIALPVLIAAAAVFYAFSLRAAPSYIERHSEKAASALS